MHSPPEHTRIPVGDLTFDLTVGGPADGDPVVLLHGFPESAASWGPVAAILNDSGLRTYAPDQRGYSPGARPDGVDAYRTEHLVADVIGILDALDLGSAHLVGHDWGAIVAWVTAARHPDRVSSLTAVSVPHPGAFGWALREDADQQERSSYIRLLRMEGKAEHVLLRENAGPLRAMFGDVVAPDLVDRHVKLLTEPGALTAALGWYRAMTSDLESTPPVTVPTTYVWSTGDMALGRAGAERCGEFVTAPYEFVVLEDATHWIPEQCPRALADAVLHRVGKDA
ncbi:MAG: alpha/beta fold hydrolase [Rhodococcus sp. (in: high G+C Gram-positive bacteria)]|uniref:alpha/beta fold hydrolase n=1 Tax=Rhodococcus sp. TaxID=1831 RepID=UPI003BAF4940